VRVTERGAAISHGRALPEPPPAAGAAITISPDGEIDLVDPSPLRVWSLTAFADQEALGPPARYRLRERSIQRALMAGFETGQIVTFLAQQSGAPPPAAVLAAIEEWARGSRHVRLEEAIVLSPLDESHIEALLALADRAGVAAVAIPGGLVAKGNRDDTARYLTALKRAGYLVTSREP
jgi:hypothetical protein